MRRLLASSHATVIALLIAGCSPTGPAPVAETPNAPRTAAAPVEPAKTACSLVTVAEMTAITGGTLVATPDETHGGKTVCHYGPPQLQDHPVPDVELSVEWGSGEGGMQAMGMLNGHEPGLVDAGEQLGDQSVRAGSAVMIRQGEDLVTIVVSGVEDEPATVRRIFDTARARL